VITRRHVFGGATAAGVAGPLLAACGSGTESQQSASPPSAKSGPTIRCACHGSIFSAVDGSVLGGPAPSALASESVAVQGDEIEVDGSVVGPKSDVPEGSGVVFRDQRVVVTQPEPGEFKAFTAVCTHQGCLVDSVEPA